MIAISQLTKLIGGRNNSKSFDRCNAIPANCITTKIDYSDGQKSATKIIDVKRTLLWWSKRCHSKRPTVAVTYPPLKKRTKQQEFTKIASKKEKKPITAIRKSPLQCIHRATQLATVTEGSRYPATHDGWVGWALTRVNAHQRRSYNHRCSGSCHWCDQ